MGFTNKQGILEGLLKAHYTPAGTGLRDPKLHGGQLDTAIVDNRLKQPHQIEIQGVQFVSHLSINHSVIRCRLDLSERQKIKHPNLQWQ